MITKKLMNEKICMVTGATSGIGEATAFGLAQLGLTVIVVGRNEKKCLNTVNKIKRKTENQAVEFMVADLSSQMEIRKLADQFQNKYQHLDVLINNAGAKILVRQESVDGYEMTFALNHLACFMLTNLLIAQLKKSKKGRIINVSSGAHSGSEIKFDDIQNKKDYVGKRAYSQSKLANLLFTYELARRLDGTGITVNALEPGGVATNFCKNNGWVSWAKHVVYYILKRELIGPEEGAKTSIYLATSRYVEGISGKYFSKQKPVRSSNASYNEESARRLWDISLEMSGLSDKILRTGSQDK